MKRIGKRLVVDRETLKHLVCVKLAHVHGASGGSCGTACTVGCKTIEPSRCICETL